MKKNSIQLFLLPYAGGSSVSFKNLLPFLGDYIETFTIEYAGRLTRRDEEFISDYDEFLKDVAFQINRLRNTNKEYAVFGYSLGSVLAYDLLSSNLINGNPSHVFLCAKGSLLRKAKNVDYSVFSDEEFAKEIALLGGIDKKILSNERFLQAFLIPVRADYIIWNKFNYKEGIIPCNATVIYSKHDPAAKGVEDWASMIDGCVDFYEFGTNHFFINEYWERVAQIVNEHMSVYV